MRRVLAVAVLLTAGFGCKWGNEFALPKPSTDRKPGLGDAKYYAAQNDFAARLSEQIAVDNGNHAASPVSIDQSLALVMNGASGKTRDELLGVFGLDENTLPAFNESQRAYLNFVKGIEGRPLKVATAVFTVWPVVLDGGYVQKMGSTYDATVKKLGSAGVGATKVVNRWVSKETDGKIQYVVDRLTKQEQLLVVSVVHFGADWETPFGPARDLSFTTPRGKVDAKMMNRSGVFEYFEDEVLQAVRLPYKGGAFSMVVMLPKEGRSPRSMLTRYQSVSIGLAKREGHVWMPKFSFSRDYELSSAAKALGAESIFSEDCNLRNISIELERGWRVSRVIHRAVVTVDELGTTASGATAALAEGGEKSETAFTFFADRPFAFAITDTTTGVVAFWGIVNDPTES